MEYLYLQRMRIAVNARLLIKDKLEGIGVFAFQSLSRIAAAHPEHEFIFIFDRPADPSFLTSPNIKAVQAGFPTRHPLLWYIWLKWSLPNALKKIHPDVFFSPDGFVPFKTTVPVLNVIHDLNFEYYPQFIPASARNFYQKYFPHFARSANRLLTVSEYSKSTIVEKYKVRPEKIAVVHNAGMEDFRPIEADRKVLIRKKWSGGSPYFLYVGSLNPRKNIQGLLKAFEAFKTNRAGDHKLLIAGSSWNMPGAVELTSHLSSKNDIEFLGHISHEDLKDILGAAFALTYVPFFEGFGIPVIEAMQSGVPVITSHCTSIPEVAGSAALLVDPHHTEQIANAMTELSLRNELRLELIRKGLENAQRFSWNRTAQQIWNNIELVAAKNI